MELRIDSWGIVFESGIADFYFQRSAIVTVLAIFVGLRVWKLYRDKKAKPAKAVKATTRKLDI